MKVSPNILAISFCAVFFSLRCAMEFGKQLGGGVSLPPVRLASKASAPDWLLPAIEGMHPDAPVSVDVAFDPIRLNDEEWVVASFRTFHDGAWCPGYRSFCRSGTGSVTSWPVSEE